ncbi:MAG: endonuclease-8 [Polyangiales bacterium]|jgi:endonuclease-8
MPEGPEIRRAADGVERAVKGRSLTEVYFAFERLKHYEDELRTLGVSRVETYGKAMLTWFGDALAVYSHNQLYGRWMTRRSDATPKSTRQLRFSMRSEKGSAFLYSASEIEVVEAANVPSHPFLAKLGPDPLHTGVGLRQMRKQMKTFGGRRLGGLLLDQSFVAGLGNYLRSEILFLSGVLPDTRPRDLDAAQQERLGKNIIAVTRRAYETGGITTTASISKAAKAAGEKRRTYRHYAFARDGFPCRNCDDVIERGVSAGRRVYVCNTCQA